MGHLLGLALLVWFWATPIVYQAALVEKKIHGFLVLGVDAWVLYLLNPMTVIVLAFQRALYGVPAGNHGSGAGMCKAHHLDADATRLSAACH